MKKAAVLLAERESFVEGAKARGIDAEAALSAAVDCRIARETEKNDTV